MPGRARHVASGDVSRREVMRQRIPRRSVIRGDVNVAAPLAAPVDLFREPRPPRGAVFRSRRVVRPILLVCRDGRRRPLEIIADRSDVRRIRKGLRRPSGPCQYFSDLLFYFLIVR